jgi:hypothetical protein
MNLQSYIEAGAMRMGIAKYSMKMILRGETVLQQHPETANEYRRFIDVYTELLEYPGAPVNNLRYERRRMSDALLQVSRAPEPAGRRPLRDGML